MIRKMQNPDINRIADIWLKTNLKAHDFIPEQYWTSTSQFNLSGMDRYWLYRIYKSRCSAAAGSSCRKSYGYCQYGIVPLLWKSRLYHRWKHLYWRWYDKTNDLVVDFDTAIKKIKRYLSILHKNVRIHIRWE